jgi:hypothetical protein
MTATIMTAMLATLGLAGPQSNGGAVSAATPPLPVAKAAITASRLAVGVGGRARVAGYVHPGLAGVSVQLDARTGGHWHSFGQAETTANGHFVLATRPRQAGTFPLRVTTTWQGRTSAVSAGRLEVFRSSLASRYEPGGTTACGQKLTAAVQGVANKTLPCGTKVTFRYQGRSVRVEVIDRGPYVGDREWDLTQATAETLGFDGVAVVGTTA